MEEIQYLDPRVSKILNPEETAILIIDVMDGYCDLREPLPKFLEKNLGMNFTELDKVADRIVDFLAASRKYPIATTVFVRMIERPESSPPSIRLKMEVEGYPPVAVKDGQGWDYYKVKPQRGDFEITKYNYDAFLNTDLDEHLKSLNVKTVIIVGGHASVCVDTTARASARRGYHTFVPADLTADPGQHGETQTPDTIRKRLDTINSVMGYMPLSSTILQTWEGEY